jgi:nucleotide-binding universal stress UspA family protein
VELAVIADHAPARAICDYAESHGVDLIVLGSHGRGGMERWLIGSVAERVVRHAACNVYVVRR